jgi:type I restriction-modification system DNA methylase subunit
MKAKENQKLLVKFKNDLFKVGAKLHGSEQQQKEESYKRFIDYAFNSMLQALGVMTFDGSEIYLNDDLMQSVKKINDSAELGQAVISYCELVRASEPFTDVFSMLHEDLLLTGRRGEGLGQFYTPSDLADAIGQLMPLLSDGKKIEDFCCGAGSLPLAVLKRCALENPQALETVTVVLNDIDELACKVAFLQVVANVLVKRIKVGSVLMFNCNTLTQWNDKDTLMVAYKASVEGTESPVQAGNVEAFDRVIAMCKDSSKRIKKAVNIY